MKLVDDSKATQIDRARRRFTRDELVGATHVRVRFGWRKVVSFKEKTVTVETGSTCINEYPFHKVLRVRLAAS